MYFFAFSYPPVSEASKEVANLTEGKNPHAPVYGVKECVCLSVCLLQAGLCPPAPPPLCLGIEKVFVCI